MYMNHRAEVFAGRKDKFVCLMDVALMAMRKLKKDGKLTDQEDTDEDQCLQYHRAGGNRRRDGRMAD